MSPETCFSPAFWALATPGNASCTIRTCLGSRSAKRSSKSCVLSVDPLLTMTSCHGSAVCKRDRASRVGYSELHDFWSDSSVIGTNFGIALALA